MLQWRELQLHPFAQIAFFKLNQSQQLLQVFKQLCALTHHHELNDFLIPVQRTLLLTTFYRFQAVEYLVAGSNIKQYFLFFCTEDDMFTSLLYRLH